MKKIRIFLEKMPPFILTAICLIAICWLTLASKPLGDTDVMLFPYADKVAHAIMFGGFTFCILLDSVRRRGWCKCSPMVAAVAVLASGVVGVATEYLQENMHAGRSGDPVDLVADCTGAVIVATICCAIRLPKRREI